MIVKIIVNQFREYFCKHDFEEIGTTETYPYPFSDKPSKITKTFLCKKCGHIKKVDL